MLNMESGSKLQRRLLIGTAVVLVSGVFAFLTYRDYRLIQTIRDEIQSTEGAIHAARAKISKIPAQEHDVIVRRENLNEYVQILPDDREINDFVSKINSFADRSGVEVSKLDDVGARNRAPVKGPKDPFEKVVYKMDLRGSTESILAFLNSFDDRSPGRKGSCRHPG
jgi:hypothetical protein